MIKWWLSFIFISMASHADQSTLVARARDSLIEKSILQLKAYCKGTALKPQEDYVYLCHLQVKADCGNKKNRACEVLKETAELEKQALVTEKSVEMVSPIPMYGSKELPVKPGGKEIVLTYNVRHGFIAPNETEIKDLRDQLEKLEAMKLRINPFRASLDCDSDAQCKLLDYGRKGCGGPMGTIVYSTKGTDLAQVKAVEEFTSLDRKIQDQWRGKLGIGDSCEYLGLSGVLTCKNSVCELK